MDVEARVLDRIRPSEEERGRLRSAIAELTAKVEGSSVAEEVDFETCLVGSIAKDTHLTDPDIDLFLLFDQSVPRKKLEDYGLRIGREAIGGREHYAEHPYIRGQIQGFDADIVPAYKISESVQRLSAVDRTPLHTAFVKEHLDAGKRDEVRLLKAFTKGIGVYGAEAKTMGFSGYLCELMVIRFGGFKSVLESASAWDRGQCIALKGVRAKKFNSPLVFIDPVDENRNVASAVSLNNMAILIAAAQDFLERPGTEFFFPNPAETASEAEVKALLANHGALLLITLPGQDIIDDILYPQLRKFQRSVEGLLLNNDFRVTASWSGVKGDSLVLLFELSEFTLPELALHTGPPVWVSENSRDFLSKWEDNPDAGSAPFIQEGRWCVLARRKHRAADGLVRQNLSLLDIGKGLNRLKDSVRVGWLSEPFEPDVLDALSTYLDKRMPWKR
jgi:tRNA nucleotidyltransferase (CCA-adding enzyme)